MSQQLVAMRRRSRRGWSLLGSLLAREKTRLALLKWASLPRSRVPLKARAQLTKAIAHTITPYVHLDVFHNPERERSFVVRSGRVDVAGLGDLMQPRLDRAAGVSVPTEFVPPHPAQFRDTMLQAIGIWQRGDFLGQLEAQYLATGLVISMLRGYSGGSSESSEEPEFLNWITSYMSLHLSEPLSVSDMAARAGLSASRFSQVFRNRFGRPPHQFLLHLRIQRAQDLLHHTSLTMREISAQCGFSDVHHFAKTFKRLAGQTPGSYRR
jgi:AraC-like DNA-binding protein